MNSEGCVRALFAIFAMVIVAAACPVEAKPAPKDMGAKNAAAAKKPVFGKKAAVAKNSAPAKRADASKPALKISAAKKGRAGSRAPASVALVPGQVDPLTGLGLRADHTCGTDVVQFQARANSPVHAVFGLSADSHRDTWHQWNSCMKDLRQASAGQPAVSPVRDFIYFQTLYLLSNPKVRFYSTAHPFRKLKLSDVVNAKDELDLSKFNRVVHVNDKGVPYDAMSAADFGFLMLTIFDKFQHEGYTDHGRIAAFHALGISVLQVITDSTGEGGLRSREVCDVRPDLHCSWFHAVTGRDHETTESGATLNKSMHPVRDLFRAAELLKRASPAPSDLKLAESFIRASAEGAQQLVYSRRSQGLGKAPSLLNFIPRKDNGEYIQNSWMYYGFNASTGKAYFLKNNDYKNCGYHLHDLNLLASILGNLKGRIDMSGFTKKREDLGMSLLHFLVKTYQIKVEDGLYVDSQSPENGNFKACDAKKTPELTAETVNLLLGL